MLLDEQGNFTLERGEGGLTITYQPTGAAMILAEKELYQLSEAILAWLELIEFQAATQAKGNNFVVFNADTELYWDGSDFVSFDNAEIYTFSQAKSMVIKLESEGDWALEIAEVMK